MITVFVAKDIDEFVYYNLQSPASFKLLKEIKDEEITINECNVYVSLEDDLGKNLKILVIYLTGVKRPINEPNVSNALRDEKNNDLIDAEKLKQYYEMIALRLNERVWELNDPREEVCIFSHFGSIDNCLIFQKKIVECFEQVKKSKEWEKFKNWQIFPISASNGHPNYLYPEGKSTKSIMLPVTLDEFNKLLQEIDPYPLSKQNQRKNEVSEALKGEPK